MSMDSIRNNSKRWMNFFIYRDLHCTRTENIDKISIKICLVERIRISQIPSGYGKIS